MDRPSSWRGGQASSIALLIALALLIGGLAAGCTAQQRSGDGSSKGHGAAASIPEVVAQVEPSVVTVIAGDGLGSGVVFRDGGLVLTNHHVVAGQRTVELALADARRVQARVVATDEITDLAVLRASEPDLPAPEFRKRLPRPGEQVLAIGSPLGLRNTVTMGIVSGVGREIPGSAARSRALVDLIQTDAAISPGNSGGALIDTRGRVVGINEAYIPPQAGAVSIGFAIPTATALDVAGELLDGGEASHPYLGIVAGRLTPQIARELGVATPHGVLVREVDPDGPAADAGLRPGDVIVGFDDERVETVEAFLGAMRGTEPGQTVTLRYVRHGGREETKAILAELRR